LQGTALALALAAAIAWADDFIPMTPIGADCLPVRLDVEGADEFARPAKIQLTDDIDFSGLLTVADDGAADILVKIDEVSGDRLRMTSEITADGELLSTREYVASSTDLYSMVHAIADDAVYELTGERGIASTMIAYVLHTTGSYSLAARGFDPRGATVMLRDTSVLTTPAWSPDGSSIAFTSFRSDNGDLYIYDVHAGRARRILSRQGLNTTPCWTSDSGSLLVTLTEGGNADIYSYSISEGSLERLTVRNSIETSASISPTGQQVVFTSDRTGSPQLYVMDIAGAGAERLSYAHSYCDSPAWSPRGDLVAYAARTSGGAIHIFVMKPDGTDVRQVTFEGTLNEDPAWGPTGRHLAFSSDRDGRRSIYVVELNSLAVKRLTDSGECYCATWSPLPSLEAD
jgi:TolB protein